jgi:hypothetical protein
MLRRIRGCLGPAMQAEKCRIAAVIMRAFSGFAALASGREYRDALGCSDAS